MRLLSAEDLWVIPNPFDGIAAWSQTTALFRANPITHERYFVIVLHCTSKIYYMNDHMLFEMK